MVDPLPNGAVTDSVPAFVCVPVNPPVPVNHVSPTGLAMTSAPAAVAAASTAAVFATAAPEGLPPVAWTAHTHSGALGQAALMAA